MKTFTFKLSIVFFFSVLSLVGLNGQTLDIQLTISPPYPSNLDAYVDRLELGILSVENTTSNPVEAFFEATLEETSGRFSVQTDGILGESVTIESGLNILSPIDVQTIFAGLSENDFTTTGLTQTQIDAIYLSRQMPEGSYRICIRAFDANGTLISNDGIGNCAEFDIQFPERPIILSPFEGEYVDTSGFLNPTWDHLLNDAEAITRTEYILKIIDLTEQSIADNKAIEAMLDPGVSPDYEEELGNVFSTTIQNDIELPLVVGHKYAMRVTAVDPDGFIGYQFGGHSEVVSFYYGPEVIEEEVVINNLPAPQLTTPTADQTLDARGGINFKWDQDISALGDNAIVADSFAYQLKLMALKNVRRGQIQALMNNENTNFLYNNTLFRKSEYVRISTQVPLEVGEQYAAVVNQVNLDLLPSNISIENGGKGDLVIFTYGDKNTDFQPDLDTLLANHVQGRIDWAFRSSEELAANNDKSFVVTSSDQLAQEETSFPDNGAAIGQTKYPLKGAQIKIVGTYGGFWFFGGYPMTIGVGSSDGNGRYAVRIQDEYLSILRNLKLIISHPSGAFEKIVKPIQLTRTDFGFLMEPEVTAANSMRLSTQILKEDFDAANDQMSINLLLQKDNFSNYPHLAQIAPNNGNDIVQYNNDEYIVAQTIGEEGIHKMIFQNHYYYEHYVAEVKKEGKPSVFYPLSSIYYQGTYWDKKVMPEIHKNFVYNVGTELSGVVFYGRQQRQRDAIVRANITQEDVQGTLDNSLEFVRVTDELGRYHFNDLPNLKPNATIDIQVEDHTIRPQAFNETVVNDGSTPLRKNIYLKNDVYTGFGRLLDQYGLPVANALIKVDSNLTTRSTNKGFFMIKMHHPLPYTVEVIADGYDPINFAPAWDGPDIREKKEMSDDLTRPQKRTQWVQNLRQSDVVSNYKNEHPRAQIDAAFFGIGETTLQRRFSSYLPLTENLKGTIEFAPKVMQNKQGIVYINARLNGELVMANISFESDTMSRNDRLIAGEEYSFSGPAASYSFTITPLDRGPRFVQFFGEVELNPNFNERIDIQLEEATMVTGIVSDLETDEPLSEVAITVEGLDFNDETEEDGRYKLYLPSNQEFTIIAKRSKYNRVDTLLLIQEGRTDLNLKMQMRDPSLPDFKTLAGYPIEIDLLEPLAEGFMISGVLTLEGNDLFKPKDDDAKSMEFLEAIVDVDDNDEENAIPSVNFYFETAELEVKAFDFAPVTVAGNPMIELRMLENDLDEEAASKAYIGGTELTLDLESNPTFSAFPFDFPNATIKNKSREDYIKDQLEDLGFEVEGKTDDEIAGMTDNAKFLFNELNFERVYLSPGSNSEDLSEDSEYSLSYDEGADFEGTFNIGKDASNTDSLYADYVVSKFAMTKLLVAKDSSTLTKDGINMQGALEMPKMIGVKMKLKDNRINIDKLSIGKNFTINELTFALDENNPIKGSMKTWQLQVNKLSLFGLGTRNIGMGFGGDIRLKKDAAGSRDTMPHLVINSFNIINQEEEGITVAADLSIREKGVKVGPLKISQESGKSVEVSLSREDWAFELKAQGLKLETTSTNAVAKRVFPLEILDFRMKSKDWSVFVAMKPNIELEFAVLKVKISKFLLNYGYDMSMDEMNGILAMTDDERADFFDSPAKKNRANLTAEDYKILTATMERYHDEGKPVPTAMIQAAVDYTNYVESLNQKFGSGKINQSDIDILKAEIAKKQEAGQTVPAIYTQTVADWESKSDFDKDRINELAGIGGDELLDDDKIGWAIGISGGVQFPVKGIDTRIHASVLLARNNDQLDFRINEILLQMEQPAFKLFASAELSFGGEKIGFAAQAELETMKRKFAANFKFYNYTDGSGIELGAGILVSTAIATGPITWHSMGGGFDFNTSKQTYKVYLTGSAGPTGVPKELSVLDDIYVSIFFDYLKCQFQPVVEGSAIYKVKGNDFGSASFKLDFCQKSVYLNVSTTQELLAGLVKLRVQGMVYIMKTSNSASAYLGINGRLSDSGGLFTANADMMLGLNFTPDSNTPQAVYNSYRTLPSIAKPGNRFHGIAITASIDVPTKSGDYGVSIGDFKAIGVSFRVSGDASAHVFKSFDRSDFQVKGKLQASASGELIILGKTFIGGSASVGLNIEGGYVNRWYFNCSGYLKMEVYNNRSLSCGSVRMATARVCAPSLPYPCRCSWWGPFPHDCSTCWTSSPCTTVPNLFALPQFKTCTNLSFSAKFEENKSPVITASN